MRLGQTWEVADWKIKHLGSCCLAESPWKVAAWENALEKVSNIFSNIFSRFLNNEPVFMQDDEDEERRLSVEGNLLDLRNYVENILAETNSHLGGIAAEVDTAQDKISKVLKVKTNQTKLRKERLTKEG